MIGTGDVEVEVVVMVILFLMVNNRRLSNTPPPFDAVIQAGEG